MKPTVVSEILAIGEVPQLEQVAFVALAGFRSILTTQPDGEVPRLPASTAIGIEAVRQGLVHAYAPISSRTPPVDELAAFERALAELPAPIYACCYSGARSAAAAAFVLVRKKDVSTVVREFSEAGHDIASLRPWLEEERQRHSGR